MIGFAFILFLLAFSQDISFILLLHNCFLFAYKNLYYFFFVSDFKLLFQRVKKNFESPNKNSCEQFFKRRIKTLILQFSGGGFSS